MVGFDADLGKVTVTDGKKVISNTALKVNGDGHLTIRLKKLKLGKHKLVVSYTGQRGHDRLAGQAAGREGGPGSVVTSGSWRRRTSPPMA